MSRRPKKRQAGEVLLTSTDVRRLESEIQSDVKAREAADARIAYNRKLLDAVMLLTAHASRSVREARKASGGQKLSTKQQRIESSAATPVVAAVPAKLPRGSGSMGIVLGVLRDNPQGLAAPDVQKKAAEHPEAPPSIKEHGQYIYSVLDTLKGRGQVTKESGKWKLANSQAAAGVH